MPRSARWPPFPPCPKRSVRKRRKSPSSFIRRTPPQWQHCAIRTCRAVRSEEHTSELQSLMRISYAVFCLKKKTTEHYSFIAIPNHNQRHTDNTILTNAIHAPDTV